MSSGRRRRLIELFLGPAGRRAAVGGATGALAVAFAPCRGGAPIGAPCRCCSPRILGAAIIALMYVLDATEIGWMPKRGTPSLWPLRILTDFGKSEYVLWVLAGLLLVVADRRRAIARERRDRCCWVSGRGCSSCFSPCWCRSSSARFSNGSSGAAGRSSAARQCLPLHAFRRQRSLCQLSVRPCHHRLCAGFCGFRAMAAGASAMMVYAVVIALSRLVLLAHHPSDVVAGALVGVIGAMAVRYWFAARRLGFAIRRTAPSCRFRALAGAPQKGCPRGVRPIRSGRREQPSRRQAGSWLPANSNDELDLPSSDPTAWPFPSLFPCATKPAMWRR